MPRPAVEVADVIRTHGACYQQAYRPFPQQRRVMRAITLCRTSELGGHRDHCGQCGYQAHSYNSCRNRHCPKCQLTERQRWLKAREEELLPVAYFHVVFTLPDLLAPLLLQNQKRLYSLLFEAVSTTLLTIAADPQHLGAHIGFLSILHTWGQNLLHHPHIHCVIPAGGFSGDGTRWVPTRKKFFLPVRVLSRLFRNRFLQGLEKAFDKHQLQFHGQLKPLAKETVFSDLLERTRRMEWVVYAKPPFGGPRQVLRYLGRYTHRIAISNHRILSLKDGRVSFRWKDYRDQNRQKVMSLPAHEFIRRFLLHVLPPGFMRIRHFGFLANRHRTQFLRQARELLCSQNTSVLPQPPALCDPLAPLQYDHDAKKDEVPICPRCQTGRMIRTLLQPIPYQDSS
jgi:hypothetical protein